MTEREKQIRESVEKGFGYTLSDMRFLIEQLDSVRRVAAKQCIENAFNSGELRDKLTQLESEIKDLHYQSVSSLPDLPRDSRRECYVKGESRAYEITLELIAKIRGEK